MPEILPPDVASRLRAPLRLTRAGMITEAALRVFWPLITLAVLGAAALTSGAVAALPPGWGLAAMALLGVAMLAALGHGAYHLRIPGPDAVQARLDATVPGQPIAALTDRQSIGADDGASRAVWQAHMARMADRLENVRAPWPDLRLAARDPYGLRLMAAAALVMSVVFGAARTGGSVSDLLPGARTSAPLTRATWEGWITPPAYTGKPSLYLNDQPPGALHIAQGSAIVVRFYGKIGALSLVETVSGAAISTPGSDVQPPEQTQFSFGVLQNGDLEITGGNAVAWQITARADEPPEIQAVGEQTRTLAGDMQQAFTARDDYGVATARARITLDLAAIGRVHGLSLPPEPRAPLVIDLPLSDPRMRTEIDMAMAGNFAEHPWAGLPVLLTFTAQDDAGQTASSAPLAMDLAGRRFLDPLALALVEQRRDLLWSRQNAPRIARLLRAISNRPDGFFRREVTYLSLRVLSRRLENSARFGLSDTLRDEVAKGLWDIAIGIEDGNLGDAQDALRRAQERLSEAMKQGASEQELAELMDELREAMRAYTEQLAQSGTAGQDSAGERGDGQEITQDDLDAMMDAIEQAMREGREEEAQQMLNALAELMENMQMAQPGPGEGGDSPGEQAMQGLADSIDEQQGLSDEAFRDLQEQSGPRADAGQSRGNTGRDGGQGRGQSHDGTGDQGDGSDGAGAGSEQAGEQGGEQGAGQAGDAPLSERQSQLADEIARQRGNLPGAGSDGGDAARQALEDAERAMNEAAEGLADGDLSGALDRQAEAIEALREGMRQLDDAMAEQQGEREGEQGTSAGQQGRAAPNDPLGRARNSQGGVANGAPLEDGADVYRRAQELLDDIRRRAGEHTRPEGERDYLQRLLDRF